MLQLNTLENDKELQKIQKEQQELFKHMQSYWKQLDHLASSDPKEYENHIKDNIRNAKQFIYPAFSIKCQERKRLKGQGNYYINFLSSPQLKQPSNTLNMNTLDGTLEMVLDDQRIRYDKQNQQYSVFDIILPDEVMFLLLEKSELKEKIILLAMSTLKTEFGLDLKNGYKILKEEYKGVFQWDEKGKKKQISDKDWIDLDLPTTEPSNHLSDLKISETNIIEKSLISELSQSKARIVQYELVKGENNLMLLLTEEEKIQNIKAVEVTNEKLYLIFNNNSEWTFQLMPLIDPFQIKAFRYQNLFLLILPFKSFS